MNKQKGLAPILIVLLIAVIGGYLIYQNQSAKPYKPFPAAAPEIKPSSSPVNETANWKTYTHPILKFSVKYPTNWAYVGDTSLVKFFPPGINLQSNNIAYPDFWVEVVDKKMMKVTFEDPIGTRKETGDKIFTSKTQNTVIDGKTAFIYKQEVLPGSQTDAKSLTGVYLDLGNKALRIIMSENKKDITDQILSTFKFQ